VTSLPSWVVRTLHGGLLVLAGLFAVAAIFAAVVMPYRLWDSLAFGSWSRAIADGGLWSNHQALSLQRPLFYLEQGLAWRLFGDHEWIGRLVSLSYAVVLVVGVWLLARSLAPTGDGRRILPPLAAALVLGSSVVATYAAAGMTDVPVAAMVAVTGAAAWSSRTGYRWVAVVAVLAAATVLAKPTGLIALAGLGAALLVLRGRRSLAPLAGLGAGVALALAYAAWQASRLGDSFADFLTAGNDAFWRERGEAARWDAIGRAEWLGASLRLVVLFGVAHALARVAGARPRVALGAGAAVAIVWSVAGPAIADGEVPYPFDGSVAGIVAWLVLAAAMVAAPVLAHEDPVARRTYAALLVWLAPMAVVWASQRADEVRHLAPAWAPLVLVSAAALASLTLALARLRPAAALAPAAAVALLVLANLPSVDGLGRDGWRDLLELGRSGWTSRAERENLAYGPFSYELNAARENVGEGDRIVSSNGRLTYFFPEQVEIAYAHSCAELESARFFSFLTAGESLEFAQQLGQPTDPLGWLQCERPRLTLVSEHEGIYAAFVVGDPPARPPAPEECRIAPSGGQDIDAVFGDGLTYGEAKELRDRAFAIGYTGGLRLERTGCSTFRVVVTGLPDDESVQAQFMSDAARAGFDVAYAPGTRFPEVPPDVSAVR
jgi:4-amino-4-deoxy-L-arabinose transferase-like glycosyltransferase